ncbi:MAG: alpha-amylase family glycosyl hydrolase, partial [Mycoplasma sp.]
MKQTLSYLILLIVMSGITSKIEYSNDNFPHYPSIYQVSLRPWIFQLSKELGTDVKTLEQIPLSKLKEIRDKGMDIFWIMGVWQVGEYGVNHDKSDPGLQESFRAVLPDYTMDDIIGSPYAITDYTCNKELCPNGDDDLVKFRQRVNGLGMKLMLDFVPNHAAFDSPWLNDNINLFIRAPRDAQPPYDSSRYFPNGVAYGGWYTFDPWTDVAQLNYWNPDTIKLMTDKLKTVAKYSDAIRCDMAYIILSDPYTQRWKSEMDSWGYKKPEKEFWVDAIKEVKASYPGTIFLAEVYGDLFKELIKEGFDYTYDKEFWDRWRDDKIQYAKDWINWTSDVKDNLCHFLENHDDNRAVPYFGGEVAKTIGAALVSYTLPGLRFFFQDQWNGYRNKLEVHLRRSYDESKSDEAIAFYSKFFEVLKNDIFKNGTWMPVHIYDDDALVLFGWNWTSSQNDDKIWCIINFNVNTKGARVTVPD